MKICIHTENAHYVLITDRNFANLSMQIIKRKRKFHIYQDAVISLLSTGKDSLFIPNMLEYWYGDF